MIGISKVILPLSLPIVLGASSSISPDKAAQLGQIGQFADQLFCSIQTSQGMQTVKPVTASNQPISTRDHSPQWLKEVCSIAAFVGVGPQGGGGAAIGKAVASPVGTATIGGAAAIGTPTSSPAPDTPVHTVQVNLPAGS